MMEHPEGFTFGFYHGAEEQSSKLSPELRDGIGKIMGDLTQREVAVMSVIGVCSCIAEGHTEPLMAQEIVKCMVKLGAVTEEEFERAREIHAMLASTMGAEVDWDRAAGKELRNG